MNCLKLELGGCME